MSVLTFNVSSQTSSAFSCVVATFFVDKIPVPVKLLTTNLPVCSTTSLTLSFEVIHLLLNLGVRPYFDEICERSTFRMEDSGEGTSKTMVEEGDARRRWDQARREVLGRRTERLEREIGQLG